MRKAKLRDLSKMEWDIMNQIWCRRKVSVAEIYSHFLKKRRWSHNTVKTMMQRLVKKGYLICDDSQRAHIYRPAVPRRHVAGKALTETLDRILDDGFGPLVAYAARRKDLSDEEVTKLKEILEKEVVEDD